MPVVRTVRALTTPFREDNPMPNQDQASEFEITDEQFQTLRDLGVPETELAGMSMADAEDLIDELRAEREAGR